MQRLLSLTLLFALFLFSIGCMERAQDPAQMIAAADELDEKFFDAYNNKDLDAMMNLYWNSPDVVSFPPGEMMLKGFDQLKESFSKDFEQGLDSKLELVEHNNRVEGSVVVGAGIWRYTMNIPGSEPMVIEGRYLDVKAERDGKWVYIYDHASVPLPPPVES
jgi:ketosteroid isomerase-like protein